MAMDRKEINRRAYAKRVGGNVKEYRPRDGLSYKDKRKADARARWDDRKEYKYKGRPRSRYVEPCYYDTYFGGTDDEHGNQQ